MGHFASGVGVVTASDRAGRAFGSTANAICSLWLQPPLVLACLRRESETLAAAMDTGSWAINLLRAEQQRIAAQFARRTTLESWVDVAHRLSDGVPVLNGALAIVECSTHDLADGGDYLILIGDVVGVEHPDEPADPLLFFRGAYANLVPPQPPDAEGEGLLVSPA